ncbi:sugar nucleotide-binding protein [Rossellomorea sp. H39__3]
MELAEEEEARAFLVNEEGTSYIAEAASAVGAVLVYISTDYVFDGKKKAPYEEGIIRLPSMPMEGRSLPGRGGEEGGSPALYCADVLGVRGGGPNFIKKILTLSETNDTLKVVDDVLGSPTYTVDLAGAIIRLVELIDSAHSILLMPGHARGGSWLMNPSGFQVKRQSSYPALQRNTQARQPDPDTPCSRTKKRHPFPRGKMRSNATSIPFGFKI